MKFWYLLVIQSLALPLDSASRTLSTDRDPEVPELLLQKAKGDVRTYQHTLLENGLRVVNIFDPNTTQAAVAVAVTVGSFSDPEEFDGLAHLLEHSMFLGSKNFPERSGFDAWLAQNGGGSNAYTAEEQTVFYASVSGKALPGCLQRYGDIFRNPLFNASWIWDEVSAVDSEHNKNRKSQEWRIESLMNLMAKEKPMSRFHTGNRETLRRSDKETLASKIREFFATHYCPARMRLVTFGAFSLEDQLKQAKTTFGSIPRQGRGCIEKTPSFQGVAPFSGSSLQMLRMQGLTPKAELHLVFPMKNLQPWIRSNPTAYLQHILSFAGKDSLLLALRDKLNVASSLSVSHEDSTAGSKIVVSLSLLPEGVDRLPVILDAFFTFIARARHSTLTQKSTVLRSLAESAQLGYDWSALQEASRCVSQVADDMTKLDARDLLVADNLILDPDVKKVDYLLNRLRPEVMVLLLVDDENSTFWQPGPTDARPLAFYDVNYTMRPLEDTWRGWQKWRSSSDPVVNPWTSTTTLDQRLVEVNTQLVLRVPGAISGLPHVILAGSPRRGQGQLGELWGDLPKRLEMKNWSRVPMFDELDVWHRENWMLRQPRIMARLILRRPQEMKTHSALNVVAAEVGSRMLNELMALRLAHLGDLGTSWRIETGSTQSFSMLLSSFSVNAKDHFRQVLNELQQHEEGEAARKQRLRRVRRELQMELEDQSEAILSVAVRERNVLLMPDTFARNELLSVLETGAEETSQVMKALEERRSGPLSMTSLVMGSCSKELAEELQDQMMSQLGIGAKVELVSVNSSERVERVVHFHRPVELRSRNPRKDRTHAMLMTLLVGPTSIKQRVLLGLTAEVLNQVAFEVLRTELQLGYVVGGSVSSISNVLTISCFVQGEVALPDLAEEHCEKVLAVDVLTALENLSDAQFANIKESFRLQLLQPPLSTGEELERFWAPTLLGRCFNTSDEMLKFLKGATKGEMVEAWKKSVMPKKVREKLVVKLFGDGHDPSTREETKVHLPQTLQKRLETERQRTLVLNGPASAKTRGELLQKGAGFYPQTLSCSLDLEESSEESLEAKSSFLRRESVA